MTPGRAATMSGSEYASIWRVSFGSSRKLSFRKSGMNSRVQTTQLMKMAYITKLKSGVTA